MSDNNLLPGDPEVCSTCGFKTHRHVQTNYVGDLTCSEFCGSTTQKEKDDFIALKKGDWGVFPCCCCGVPIEGEYDTETCSDCNTKLRYIVLGMNMVYAKLAKELAGSGVEDIVVQEQLASHREESIKERLAIVRGNR